MDLWVVAAAAAAGYIAKYWQKGLRDRDSFSEFSSKGFEKPESPSCPFRGFASRKNLDKDVCTDRRKNLDPRYTNISGVNGGSAAEVASTSKFDGENQGILGNYEDCNVLSISSLPPGVLPGDNLERSEFGIGMSGKNSIEPSMADSGSFHGSARNRSSLRTTYSSRHFVKPLTSLESCLLAQLYQKHTKMEDYVISFLPSPSTPTMRSLLVTDGSQVISRASVEFGSARLRTYDSKLHKEAYSGKNGNVLGLPPLPQTEFLDLHKKVKFKSGIGRSGRLSSCSKFSNGSLFRSRGLQDGTSLFCLGISIGVISSLLTNRREVNKLKELLKQRENLVQDLQEELEMKDSLTVKELANENYELQDTCDNSFTESIPNLFLVEKDLDNLTKQDGKELDDNKAEESLESMSKIEAELEAELERMGLNMNSSILASKLSDFVELDTDFEVDFVQGELRADMINRQVADQTESNKDASGTSTSHSAKNAVSPRELSLRLHEVIQSRLEERVKELEVALENSQRKVQIMESEQKNSWRKFSNIELRYSSDEESAIAKEECYSMAQPLVMNLSGEALDAYNEAYEELMKINESEEEDSLSNDHQNGGIHDSLPHLAHNKEKPLKEYYFSQGETLEEQSLRVEESSIDVGLSGDENSDYDDEMEKQLIKQIVEKTRKGSPAVLNAQRWLFYSDEDEH